MATQVASLFADLAVRDNATTALAGFENTLQRAGGKLTQLGDQVGRFGTKLVTTFGPFAALFGLSISKFSSFEEAMRNAHSILGTNEDDMQAINDQILELGSNTRAGPQAVAEAYYDIVSGVQDTTTHMGILNAAIATSEAGNADLMATTSALVGVMNSYGFSADDAAFVSDVFTRSVQMGVLTMDDLAGALPNVTGMAGNLGVGLDEVSSSLAFITTKGFSASEASTQLRAAMISMVNPNETMIKALDELGVASGEALIEQYGLVGALQAIADTSVVADSGLAKTLGSTEAYNAALNLTTDAADAFITKFQGLGELMGGVEFESFRFGGSGAQAAQDWMDRQGGIEGATAAAREIQLSGPAAELDLLNSKVDDLAITVGETLVPALTDMMDTIGPVVEDVTEWAEKNPELVSSVGMLVIGLTGLGLVLIPLGSLLSMGGTLLTGLGWLAGSSGFVAVAKGASMLVWPFSTLAGYMAGALVTGWSTMVTGISGAVMGFSGLLGAISPLLLPAGLLGGIVAAYVTDFGGFKTKISETGEAIRDGDIAGVIQGVADSMLAIPLGLATEFGDLVGIDVPGGLAAWEPVISGVAGALQSVANQAGNAIIGLLKLTGLKADGGVWGDLFGEGVLPALTGGETITIGGADVSMPESQDSGGSALAGSMNVIGVGAQPEAFIPTTSGFFVPNIDEMFNSGRGGNVMVINVNNPQFNGVQDPASFYDMMSKEGQRRAPMGIN